MSLWLTCSVGMLAGCTILGTLAGSIGMGFVGLELRARRQKPKRRHGKLDRQGWVIFGGTIAMVVLFGVFLIFTGIKIFLAKEKPVEPEKNFLIRLLRRVLPVTPDLHGSKFLARVNGRTFATPLLIALIFLEATDVVFAVDSVPAIFAVTSEPLIVFTSNIFAILGLRALFFMLAGAVDKFHLLRYGLGAVLLFVGLKMVWLNQLFDGHFPIWLSLGIICTVLFLSVAFSLVFPKRPEVRGATTD